uniref:Putative secreted protein n=1 Tax=Ixodes ricinus TaxID=34613 RepID=A0A6B0TUQ1_IXORI
MRRWFSRWAFWQKVLAHVGHVYGRSLGLADGSRVRGPGQADRSLAATWPAMCVSSWPFWLNTRPQKEQLQSS